MANHSNMFLYNKPAGIHDRVLLDTSMTVPCLHMRNLHSQMLLLISHLMLR